MTAVAAKSAHADGDILFEMRGAVALVTLNRPHKRNALNTSIVLALEDLFASLPEAAKAAVIAGVGDHFSAGLDLSEVTEQDVAEGIQHSRMWHRAFERIQFGRVPVVSALHGAVVGGGLELAASTHIRVAEKSTFYALPEGQRGIFVGGGGSVRIPRLVGTPRMMDMMLTGRTYGAEEGMPLGFSQYVVENGQGLAKALELAARIAGNAPMTNFGLIHALPRIAESDMSTGFAMEALIASVAQADGEAKRRLHDFLEKRAAKVVRVGGGAETMAWAIRKHLIEWGDCDPAGIVFNPRYFEWFDAATAGLFRQGGIDKTELVAGWGIVIPVVETRAQFLKPSRWGDEISIQSRIVEYRRSSFAVEHRLANAAGETCVIGNETRVCSAPDAAEGNRLKSAAIPPEVAALFDRFRGD